MSESPEIKGNLAIKTTKAANNDNITFEPDIPIELVKAAKAIDKLLRVPTLKRPDTKEYNPIIPLPTVEVE